MDIARERERGTERKGEREAEGNSIQLACLDILCYIALLA